jgi:hypothetical protein
MRFIMGYDIIIYWQVEPDAMPDNDEDANLACPVTQWDTL